jgi:hypothetical protein
MGRKLALRLYWVWRREWNYGQFREFGSYAREVKQSRLHLLSRFFSGFAVHFCAAGTERALDVANDRRNLRVGA